jgi:hypothetical protein
VRVDGVLDDKLLLEDGTVDHLFLDLDLALDSLGVRLESDEAKNMNRNVRFCVLVSAGYSFTQAVSQSVMCSHRSPSDSIHSFIQADRYAAWQSVSQSICQAVIRPLTQALRQSIRHTVRVRKKQVRLGK